MTFVAHVKETKTELVSNCKIFVVFFLDKIAFPEPTNQPTNKQIIVFILYIFF